jgi:hypothetical protein
MIYREGLDALAGRGCHLAGCTHENHGPLFLHGRCHLGAPVEVSYMAGSGAILVRCMRCKKTVAEIAVAPAPPPPADEALLREITPPNRG